MVQESTPEADFLSERYTQRVPTTHSFQILLEVGLALALIVVPLYFSPQFEKYSIPKIAIIRVFAIGLSALWIIGMILDGEVSLVDTSIIYTFLGFLAIHLMSLFQSYNTTQGLDTLFQYLCYFALALLVFHVIRSRPQMLRLAGAMLLSASAVATLGLLQHNDVIDLYGRWNIAVSTIGNVNYVAEYYDVVYPLSIAMIFVLRRFWLQMGALLSCFLMSCHLIVLGSRGGWLGAGCALALFGVMAFLRHYRVGRRLFDLAFISVVVACLSWPVLVGMLSSVEYQGGETLGDLAGDYWRKVTDRTEDAIRLQDNSSQQRVLLWEDTLRLIFDRPLVGVGVGNFEYNIPRFTSRKSLEVKARMEGDGGSDLMAFRAHNEYLEVWAETGLLGFGALCFLLVQIGGALWMLLKRYLRGEEDLFVVGLAGAVVATLAHAFFSTNFQDPASALSFWIVVGMIWSLKVNAEGRRHLGLLVTDTGAFAFGAISVCVLVFGATLFAEAQTLRAASQYRRGRELFLGKRYDAAAEAFDTAARLGAPQEFAVWQALGLSHYNRERWQEAAAALEQSVRYHGANPASHYYLGQASAQLGDYDRAVTHAARAAELNPVATQYRLGYGQVLTMAGRPGDAVHILHEVVSERADDVHALRELADAYAALEDMESAADWFQKALLLEPSSMDLINSLAVTEVRLTRFTSARVRFEELIRMVPSRADYRVNYAVVLLNQGDHAGAIDATREALTLEPGMPEAQNLLNQLLQGAYR